MSRLLSVARAEAAIAVTELRIGGAPRGVPPPSSGSRLTTPVPVKVARLQTIERARQAYGISQERLAAEAGISSKWYRQVVQHPSRCSEATIASLQLALRRISARRDPDDGTREALIRATYHGFLLAVCQVTGLDLRLVKADDPRVTKAGDPHWLRRSRARQAAVYLTNQALGVRQRPLARALELTPAAVCQSLRNIEDLRDDPDFDRVIDEASRLITGEGL